MQKFCDVTDFVYFINNLVKTAECPLFCSACIGSPPPSKAFLYLHSKQFSSLDTLNRANPTILAKAPSLFHVDVKGDV